MGESGSGSVIRRYSCSMQNDRESYDHIATSQPAERSLIDHTNLPRTNAEVPSIAFFGFPACAPGYEQARKYESEFHESSRRSCRRASRNADVRRRIALRRKMRFVATAVTWVDAVFRRADLNRRPQRLTFAIRHRALTSQVRYGEMSRRPSARKSRSTPATTDAKGARTRGARAVKQIQRRPRASR